ncbi:MAG: cation:proton antiporter, partial [Candidatus Woesearchaeota archaeon]
TQVVVGVGAGVLVGIIFFKVMRKAYSDSISPLALLTSALLAFVLSEQIGGSGILSVAVLGFVFGNSTISKKEVLQDFSSIISNVLVIMVFLLLGFIISLELSFWFIIKSLIAFLLVAIARYFAVQATLIHSDFTKKEKLYMVLSVPKGIGTAVLLFTLSTIPIPELTVLINLSVMIILYSVILATIVNKFSKNFIGIKIAKK